MSGKNPIAVSGIANSACSLATRAVPCTDTPMPPPMQIPSTSAT
jgi:hypothetical protein